MRTVPGWIRRTVSWLPMAAGVAAAAVLDRCNGSRQRVKRDSKKGEES